MPYALKKMKNGYYVVTVETGEKHSKRPLSKEKAEAQLRILLKQQDEEQAQNTGITLPYPKTKHTTVKIYDYVQEAQRKKQLPKASKSLDSQVEEMLNHEGPVKQVYDAVRKVKQEKKLKEIARQPQTPETEEEYLRTQKRHQSINRMLDNPEFMEQLKKVDPLNYNKLLNMPDEMVEGGGLFDFLKTAGKKVTGLVSNLGKRISGTITGRNDYAPAERTLIDKYGNMPIKSVCIYKEPLEKAVNMLTNALSVGQMGQLKKKYGFDEMYHLYMVVTVQESQDKLVPILLEKNEVINIHEYPNVKPNAEKLELYLSPKFNYTFKQFLDNGQRVMGSRYFTYDPFDNNCQVFIASLISANPPLEQDNPNAQKFIMQDVQGLKTELNPVSRALFRGTTGLAGRMNVLLKGYGFI
jgi:hypothetical protein